MRILPAIFIAIAAWPAWAQDIEEGEAAFMAHCAGCHGASARGDGPMAPLLSIPPADLTGIAGRNNGTFPTSYVIRRIDGTTDMLAHGGAMPVYGLLMEGPSAAILAPDGAEVVAPEGIVNITGWLEGLQE